MELAHLGMHVIILNYSCIFFSLGHHHLPVSKIATAPTPTPTNVAFILGAGPRVGWSVALKFRDEGYKVAIGSRTPDLKKAKEHDVLTITLDVSDIQSVEDACAEVKKQIGVPNVVVYNDMSDPFASVTPSDLLRDFNINATGAYAALRQAIFGFKTLNAANSDVPKVFIATGTTVPLFAWPHGLTVGVGKAALAQMIQAAEIGYGKEGFRFYFASQVVDGDKPVPNPSLNGEAHATAYWDIVRKGEQGPWSVYFDEGGNVVLQS
ncbi:hypothetical protein AJ79_09103 [Helicocarpus griseus UAMH5409]|uniref:Uncharacterized protein n=1 Tax=Helicocarpus griseus UAMH5409 TaxID=1447875 RepID=A0A2B7WML0_9EURO|nr:hypothetical protein AJ79_09103 [Helicocarpus griseus UAMH5409]